MTYHHKLPFHHFPGLKKIPPPKIIFAKHFPFGHNDIQCQLLPTQFSVAETFPLNFTHPVFGC